MVFHSFVSDEESTADALDAIVSEAGDAAESADMALLFFTQHHLEHAQEIVEKLWLELDPQCLVGCSAEGVIAEMSEIERAPGLALMTATLPGVRVQPFHIAGTTAWHQIVEDAEDLTDRLGVGAETAAVIAMADPFSTPLDSFLTALARGAPGVPLIGGMASTGRSPGGNVLIRNDEVFTDGMVGLSLSGPIEVETIVSQGARPLGKPMLITRSRENVIEQLGGKSAVEALREVVAALSPADVPLLQKGLLIGRAISEYRESFGRGDFLVRNVIGVDEEAGTVTVADLVRTGQTVQFHVRDAATASEDLAEMLAARASGPAAGGLLVSCNGRGSRLFGRSGHDILSARKAFPDAPMAGFFAAGEFGNVGGMNFIHGHTASLALFRPKAE